MKNTPVRLKKARQDAELSQLQFAELAGLSRNTISSIERCTGEVPEIKLSIIAEYERITGVSAESLIFGEDLLEEVFMRLREAQSIIHKNIDRTIDILEEERTKKLRN